MLRGAFCLFVLACLVSGSCLAEGTHAFSPGISGRGLPETRATSGLGIGACTVDRPPFTTGVSLLPPPPPPVSPPPPPPPPVSPPPPRLAPVLTPVPPPPQQSSACPRTCPQQAVDEKVPFVDCEIFFWVGDVGITHRRRAVNECLAKRKVCDDSLRENGSEPRKFESVSCLPVTTNDYCALQPAEAPSGSPCSMGGPLTYYFDRAAGKCRDSLALGGCSARGPFETLQQCEAAVAAHDCEPTL